MKDFKFDEVEIMDIIGNTIMSLGNHKPVQTLALLNTCIVNINLINDISEDEFKYQLNDVFDYYKKQLKNEDTKILKKYYRGRE